MKVMNERAEMFARESALISGYVTLNGDEMFRRHVELAVCALKGPQRVSPIVFNMNLFGDQSIRLRLGIPGGMIGFLPKGTCSRRILDLWDRAAKKVEHQSSSLTETQKERVAWDLHDFLICAHPFARGNGRTVRLAWASLRTAIGLSPQVILYEEARAYHARVEKYRAERFVPLMHRRGLIT